MLFCEKNLEISFRLERAKWCINHRYVFELHWVSVCASAFGKLTQQLMQWNRAKGLILCSLTRHSRLDSSDATTIFFPFQNFIIAVKLHRPRIWNFPLGCISPAWDATTSPTSNVWPPFPRGTLQRLLSRLRPSWPTLSNGLKKIRST